MNNATTGGVRKLVEIRTLYESSYMKDWPPTDAIGCVAWFTRKLDAVPEEYRANALIDISGADDYDNDTYVRIVVSYKRPETDAEMSDRLDAELQQKQLRKEYELFELARLKKKYGEG